MTRLDKPLAVEGAAITEPTGWQQALRIGPVVDTTTGVEVVDVDAALCAEIAKGFTGLGGRMRTPVDLNHGLTGRNPAGRRTYGYVSAVDAREDGLYVKLSLNKAGAAWVEENKGNAFLSPTIGPALYDPEKAGVLLSSAYLITASLTEMPRQSRLPEVALSRDGVVPQRAVALARLDSRADLRMFEDALRRGARVQLMIEGLLSEEWLGLDDWEGDTSGTAVFSWYTEDKPLETRRVTWTRAADGVVTVAGPSVPVQAVTTYQPIPAAQAATNMSRADGPKEAPMPGSTSGTGAAQLQPYAVLLSRVPDDARAEVEKTLSGLVERVTKAEAELGEKTTALSRAEAAASTREESVVALSQRLAEVEAKNKAREQADAERAFNAFFDGEIVALGRGATDAATREKWRKRVDALGLDGARGLAGEIPQGAHGPVALARAPGLEGESRETSGDRDARVAKRATELAAANANMNFASAWAQAEKENG